MVNQLRRCVMHAASVVPGVFTFRGVYQKNGVPYTLTYHIAPDGTIKLWEREGWWTNFMRCNPDRMGKCVVESRAGGKPHVDIDWGDGRAVSFSTLCDTLNDVATSPTRRRSVYSHEYLGSWRYELYAGFTVSPPLVEHSSLFLSAHVMNTK